MTNYDKLILDKRENDWINKRNNTFERFYKLKCSENKIVIDLDKLDFNLLNKIYEINKSITQSFRSSSGKNFELIIMDIFNKQDISYSYQVHIDKNNKILKNAKNSYHTVDFIIPEVKYGENINTKVNDKFKYTVISCKTTIRERILQDKSYKNLYVITLDNQKNKYNINSIVINKIEKNFTKFLKLIKNDFNDD